MKTRALFCAACRTAFFSVLAIAACIFCPRLVYPSPTAESLRQQDQIVRGEEARQRQLEKQHKEMLERQPQQIEIPQAQTLDGTAQSANDKVTAYASRADLLNTFQNFILNPLTGDRVYGTVVVTEEAGFRGIEPFMPKKATK